MTFSETSLCLLRGVDLVKKVALVPTKTVSSRGREDSL